MYEVGISRIIGMSLVAGTLFTAAPAAADGALAVGFTGSIAKDGIAIGTAVNQ